MSMVFYLLPLVVAYAVFRGVRHLRAGRQMWAYQFFIAAGFVTLFILFELWIQFVADQG